MHHRRRKVSSGELGEFVIRQVLLIAVCHVVLSDVIVVSAEVILAAGHLTEKTIVKDLAVSFGIGKRCMFYLATLNTLILNMYNFASVRQWTEILSKLDDDYRQSLFDHGFATGWSSEDYILIGDLVYVRPTLRSINSSSQKRRSMATNMTIIMVSLEFKTSKMPWTK